MLSKGDETCVPETVYVKVHTPYIKDVLVCLHIIYLSVYLSIYSSIYPFIHPFVHPILFVGSSIYPSSNLSIQFTNYIHVFIHPFIHLHTPLSIHSIHQLYPCIHSSIHPFTYPIINPFHSPICIHVSIHPSIHSYTPLSIHSIHQFVSMYPFIHPSIHIPHYQSIDYRMV